MANPQKENGHTVIANEILETMAKTYFSSYEIQIIFAIFRKTYGWQKKEDWITNNQLSDMTGIAKSNVTRTIKKLVDRNMLIKNGKKIGFQKNYEKWQKLSKQITKVIQIDNKKLSIQIPTKEKKETIQKKNTNNIINKRDINNIIADQAFQGVENITVKQFKKYNSIFYSIDENQWYIDTDIYDKWVAIFSDFDIDVELKEMGRWLEKRPERYRALTTKGNYAVWCCNWFYRKRKWAKENNKSVEEIRSEGADDFSKAFAENNFKM